MFSLIKSPQISLLAALSSIVAAGCFACHFIIPDLIRQKLSPLSANGCRWSLIGSSLRALFLILSRTKDVNAENAKRKNDILEKRSFDCTSSEVDESQTSSKKDDLHEELMENV
ncbi:L10-interacting MYB domain-containing protein-like [Cucumis melo var. makuwa]|uniref:L10-interacting MYB domain-containing protein-like n=1 Tax=Cucumis melo var. makuwa TaxID=1194695 RepID=A0A5D3CTK5_CUCMM|nr:L10-interacting MYB domain-containing protein-like [Cucumis melo var. makuwa]